MEMTYHERESLQKRLSTKADFYNSEDSKEEDIVDSLSTEADFDAMFFAADIGPYFPNSKSMAVPLIFSVDQYGWHFLREVPSDSFN